MKFPKVTSFIPDVIIILGVILYLQPRLNEYIETSTRMNPISGTATSMGYYQTDWDEIGIILIVIGIDIILRKFIKSYQQKV